MRPVRWLVMTAGMLTVLTACGHWLSGSSQPALVEAEFRQVAGCEQVGTPSETIDSGTIITALARRQMFERLEARARALEGTHLVWVYRTDQTAAARVFRCTE